MKFVFFFINLFESIFRIQNNSILYESTTCLCVLGLKTCFVFKFESRPRTFIVKHENNLKTIPYDVRRRKKNCSDKSEFRE